MLRKAARFGLVGLLGALALFLAVPATAQAPSKPMARQSNLASSQCPLTQRGSGVPLASNGRIGINYVDPGPIDSCEAYDVYEYGDW